MSEALFYTYFPRDAFSTNVEFERFKTRTPDVFIALPHDSSHCGPMIQGVASSGLAELIRARGGMIMPQWCRTSLDSAKAAADGWYAVDAPFKHNADSLYAKEPFIEFVNQNLKTDGLDPDSWTHGAAYRRAYAYVEALRIAAELPGGVSRTNLILAVRGLDIYHPLLVDGIRFQLDGNADAYPIEAATFARYDSSTEQRLTVGDLVDVNGRTPNCDYKESTVHC